MSVAIPLSPTITLERAIRRFGDAIALAEVTLTVQPGELVAVIGRSGAGKTTLLRCLAGVLAPSEGAVRFDGQDLAALRGPAILRHRARVGMVYQQFNLVRRLRVLDNVLVGRLGHLRGIGRWAAVLRRFPAREREIALRCLHHVGLLDRAWQRADTLSGGEQQRVAIARVLAQEPVVVLADEPVASLDLANGRFVMATLRRIAAELGITVVATLHHVEYAREYSDRILGLARGRVVFDGPTATLTPRLVEDLFGEAAAPPAAPPAIRLATVPVGA
jgi:phosphonate transport system ATP-binding protein